MINYVDERVTPNMDEEEEKQQFFVCTEIAAAESIDGLGHEPQKAN